MSANPHTQSTVNYIAIVVTLLGFKFLDTLTMVGLLILWTLSTISINVKQNRGDR